MNPLNNFLQTGNVNADVSVSVSFDPLSSLLLALFIMAAIVLSNFAVKALIK